MKQFVVLVLALFALATAALAEPITYAIDERPVTLEIAKWVYVNFADEGEPFYLDVEAGTGGASATKDVVFGHNCDGDSLCGVYPNVQMGTWGVAFGSTGSEYRLFTGTGEEMDTITVTVSGITINDAAGLYENAATVIVDILAF
jgi:hypothetical protein